MTGEMHSMIVRAGLAALRQLPPEEQAKLVGYKSSNLNEHISWVEMHPMFRSEEDDKAMNIIRRAAEHLNLKKLT